MPYRDFEDYWAQLAAGEGPLGQKICRSPPTRRSVAAYGDRRTQSYEGVVGTTARGTSRVCVGCRGPVVHKAGQGAHSRVAQARLSHTKWDWTMSGFLAVWRVAGKLSFAAGKRAARSCDGSAASRRSSDGGAKRSIGARRARSLPERASGSSRPRAEESESCTRAGRDSGVDLDSRAMAHRGAPTGFELYLAGALRGLRRA